MNTYKCKNCNLGVLIPTGVVYESYPVQYEHKCSVCGEYF